MLEIILGFLIDAPSKIDLQPVHVAQAYYEQPMQEPVPVIDPDTTIEGNCYLYVSQFVKLPLTRDIKPNASPYVGVVVILQYKVPHYAIVEKLTEDGFWVKESNYIPNKIGTRFIPWNDKAIRGFYSPFAPVTVEVVGEP